MELIVNQQNKKLSHFTQSGTSLTRHNSPPVKPVPNPLNSLHTPLQYLLRHRPINIIVPSTTDSSNLSPQFRFSNYDVNISHLIHSCYRPLQLHFPWLHEPNNVSWRLKIVKLLIPSSIWCSNTFSDTLKQGFNLLVWNQNVCPICCHCPIHISCFKSPHYIRWSQEIKKFTIM